MIKVKDGTASREPLPNFLYGLLPESLVDLSWTDPSLGVQDCAWWPEEDVSGELGTNKKWGAEVLTLDVGRQVVNVIREQLNLSESEILEKVNAAKPSLTLANNSAYDSAISKLTADYPSAEIATWERQRAEVVAWNADSTTATPWIDIAAAARGLDRNEYLTRTLAKVNAFAKASAFLTGRRQGIDDQIKAATTADELNAIVINYTLPGASVW